MGLREKIRAYRPARPPRVPDSPEVRARLLVKMEVFDEWKANGKYTAKDERGNWRYGVEDLNREADSRIAGGGE